MNNTPPFPTRLQALFSAATLLATIFSLAPTSFAEDPKLQNRVIEAPLFSFKDHDGKIEETKIRPLPLTRDGEKRDDVREWLTDIGATFQKNESAILLERTGVIVVRASEPTLDFIERAFETNDVIVIRQIEISANLWSYDGDAATDPLTNPRTLEQLRKQAGPSLKLLAANTVSVKSGNRAHSITHTENGPIPAPPIPAPQPKPDANGNPPVLVSPFADGSHGTALSVEPNTGQFIEELSMELEYHARLALPGEPDLTVDFSDSTRLRSGTDVVILRSTSQPAAGAKPRFQVLTLSAQIVDDHGRTLDEVRQSADADRKLDAIRREETIRRAQEGILPE